MKKLDKKKVVKETKDILLVLLGCFVLALADALFIMPCNIVNGGVDSVGVIINYYLKPIFNFDFTDIVIGVSQTLLWIIGLFFLGKRFSFHTLLGSLAFPAFYSLLLRLNIYDALNMSAFYSHNLNSDGSISLAALLVAGAFGGALSGLGVSLAFIGHGSTGGFDVISFIIAKFSPVKQDLSGFILDSSLIIIALICMKNYELAFAGIVSAIVCAVVVQLVFIYSSSSVVVDIISSKPGPIIEYIQDHMGHSSTIVDAIGGYSGKSKKLIKVVIFQNEVKELKDFIAFVDPKAFVSLTEAKAIHGEGFEPLYITNRGKRRLLEEYGTPKKKEEKIIEIAKEQSPNTPKQ
jgi:uncharacterized membrane-anchored protein YitT (DUF2179 family)